MEEELNIDELSELALKLIKGGEEAVEIYLLEPSQRLPSATDINRTTGVPIGVTDAKWPLFGGNKMFHAITIDLEQAPNLKAAFPDCRAFSVFVSDYFEHEIGISELSEVSVIGLTQEDIDMGENHDTPVSEDGFVPESFTFGIRKVSVPRSVFDHDIYEKYEESNPLLAIVGGLLTQSNVAGFIGGSPLWLHAPEYEGEFVIQFCDSLVEMNLADAGYLYVFKDKACLQG